MGTEEVQLLHGRCAGRPRKAGRQDQIVACSRRAQQHAGRPRPFGEVTGGQSPLRFVGGAVDASAELQRRVGIAHFLVHKRRGIPLTHGGREGLGPDHVEIALHEPAADGADQVGRLAVRQQQFAFHRTVLVGRADLGAFQFLVLVVTESERGTIRLEEAVHLRGARARAQRVTPRREADVALFHKRHAILGVGVAVAGTRILVVARPRGAHVAHRQRRLRVGHLALGREVAAAVLSAAACRKGKAPVPHRDAGGRSDLVPVVGQVDVHPARWRRHRLRGNLVGHHIHQAADGVGSVEQRRRAADHLDAASRRRVDRHAVVGRLARQIAHALAVLEHDHAVAIKAADDRTGRGGTEGPRRDARRILQRAGDGRLLLLRQFLSTEHRRRLVGVELGARRGAD